MRASTIVNRLLEADPDEIDLEKYVQNATPKEIQVVGRHWWRRGFGGTYYVFDVYVDGKHVHTSTQHGGSGDQYVYVAFDWLEQHGYINIKRGEGKHGNWREAPWQTAERMGFKLIKNSYDVKRERDL